MSELDSFFEDCNSGYKDVEPESPSEKIIKKAEQEFRGFSKEQQSRHEERQKILKELKTLRIKFRRLRNTKNVRKKKVNAQKARKRAVIKKKMEVLRVRLQEISEEEP